MHRCFVGPAQWSESEAILPEDEEHHLLHVLRAQPGDTVMIFDGRGREAPAEVISAPASGTLRREPARTTLRVTGDIRFTPREKPALVLIQSIPKGKRMDLIVEKATELGVSQILPVISERAVVRLTDSQRRERQKRWQRIALSAARQCGTVWLPEVMMPVALAEFMTAGPSFDLFLVGSLRPPAASLRRVVNRAKGRALQRISLLIGPEGDLSPSELEAAVNAGAVEVSFGTSVLRVETAALYGLTVLVYEFLTDAAHRSPPGANRADRARS